MLRTSFYCLILMLVSVTVALASPVIEGASSIWRKSLDGSPELISNTENVADRITVEYSTSILRKTLSLSGTDEPPADSYDEGYRDGRQACVQDPVSCGIEINGGNEGCAEATYLPTGILHIPALDGGILGRFQVDMLCDENFMFSIFEIIPLED